MQGPRQAVLEQVFIEPTVRCNLRCRLCFTGRGDVPSIPDMTFAQFVTLLSQLPTTCRKLSLYNFGESLLHRDICRMVRAAAERGLNVVISTNFNVAPRYVSEIVRSGLNELTVSLDGVTPESYLKYRVGGRLELVLFNIRLFLRERSRLDLDRPRLTLQFLVMRHNEGEIEAFRALARQLGADQVVLKSINLRTYTEDNSLLPSDPALRRYEADGTPYRVSGECPWPWTGCVVLCDGTVQPCCITGHDPRSSVGNALTEGLMEIWTGARYEAFRQEMLHHRPGIPACKGCCSSALPEYKQQMTRLNSPGERKVL